jgi:3-oxoadipate enol-lactonase
MASYLIRFIKANRVKLRLAVTGSGPPLLFLFGSGAAGSIDNARPLVDRFSDEFMVACPDQRGLGESEIPPGPWTMSDYAQDAFAVADYLGWDRFSVLGISFGGMVGLEMAGIDPDRIEKMVLWGCSPGGAAHSYPLHEMNDLPPEDQRRKFAELMDTRLADQWGSDEQSPESMLVQAVLEHGGSPWHVAGADRDRERGLAMQLEARRGHDTVDRLGQMTCPVLVGAGSFDGLAPLENAELMAAALPDCTLRVYDAGHFFYLGRKAFNDCVGFLTGTPVPPVKGRALTAEGAVERLQ